MQNKNQSTTIPKYLRILIISFISTLVLFGCSLSQATPTPDFPTIPTVQVTIPAAPTASRTPTEHSPMSDITATLSEMTGEVMMRAAGHSEFMDASINSTLNVNAQIKTMEDSRARLDISDGAIIRLGPSTIFTFEGVEESPTGQNTMTQIDAGELWVILSGSSVDRVDVESPSGVASVRGSYLYVKVDEDTNEIKITCLEGNCQLSNRAGSVSLVAGETATITNAFMPPTSGRMDDADVQYWLDHNPEATIVILPLTQTVSALPSITPTGLYTSTSSSNGTIPRQTGTQEPTATSTTTQ